MVDDRLAILAFVYGLTNCPVRFLGVIHSCLEIVHLLLEKYTVMSNESMRSLQLKIDKHAAQQFLVKLRFRFETLKSHQASLCFAKLTFLA